MASEKPTLKNKYKSMYDGGYLTAHQYITEMLVSRKAFANGQRLSDKFWNKPEWQKEFKLTILFVSKLLRVYKPEAVIRALSRPDMQHVFSTNFPGLTKKILEEQAKLDEADKIKPPEISENRDHKREEYGNKTLIGKLRDLE